MELYLNLSYFVGGRENVPRLLPGGDQVALRILHLSTKNTRTSPSSEPSARSHGTAYGHDVKLTHLQVSEYFCLLRASGKYGSSLEPHQEMAANSPTAATSFARHVDNGNLPRALSKSGPYNAQADPRSDSYLDAREIQTPFDNGDPEAECGVLPHGRTC